MSLSQQGKNPPSDDPNTAIDKLNKNVNSLIKQVVEEHVLVSGLHKKVAENLELVRIKE